MFKELSLLFRITPHNSSIDDIRRQIYDDNILQKNSVRGEKRVSTI